MSNTTKLITDLTCALPITGWTDSESTVHKPVSQRPPGGWRVVDYVGSRYAGRYLSAMDDQSCELTIPLNLTGWHALSLGLAERQPSITAIEVKLTGDDKWQLIMATDGPMHEDPWIICDLTGKDLHIRFPRCLKGIPRMNPGAVVHAQLYSVRAVAVDEADVKLIQQESLKPLYVYNDGFGIFYNAAKPGPEIVTDALGAFKNSDFTGVAFCPGGADICNYPTKVGTVIHQHGWYFPRAGDVSVANNVRGLIEQGYDAMKLAVDTAHAQNQDLLIYTRPQGWMGDPEYGHALCSDFYRAHPELRCVEANGKPNSKLSYAYPKVRAQLNGIIKEALDRGADGACLVLVRGYPVVRYEQPVIDAFKARYGFCPTILPETDPRLQTLWADIATDWIREVRTLLDGAGAHRNGGRKHLSVMPGPDFAWNQTFGYDIARWAHEGLIDSVMPYPKGFETSTGHVDVAQYKRGLTGTNVKLLPSLGSWGDHRQTLAQYRSKAHRFYTQGADGLCRWDAFPHLAHLGLNNPTLNRLWVEKYMGPQDMSLLEVGGLNMECYGPLLGF